MFIESSTTSISWLYNKPIKFKVKQKQIKKKVLSVAAHKLIELIFWNFWNLQREAKGDIENLEI